MDEAYRSESNGAALVATAVVFLILTWISVGLRTYVRAWMTNGFQSDDVLMLVSLAIFTISCSFILTGVGTGIGRHNDALALEPRIQSLKWQALATATYVLNMMFIKLSLGIFLLRFSVQRRYHYILWTTLVVVFIWSTVLFFWDIFQCSPVAAQWDFTILQNDPKAHCVTSEEVVAAAYSLSVMSVLTDWLFALLPIFMIWNVKMTRQAKLTVTIILGLGVFASIATLIRLKFLAELNNVDDILFAGTDPMVWTLIEPGVAIIASSLVTIRPLLQRLRLKGFESTKTSGSSGPHTASNRPTGRSGGAPGELTLIDLETGGDDDYTELRTPPLAKANPRTSVKVLDRRHLSAAPSTNGSQSASQTDLRSETYVIEGSRASDDWSRDRIDSSNSDPDEINTVEAHVQEAERAGWGRGRGR